MVKNHEQFDVVLFSYFSGKYCMEDTCLFLFFRSGVFAMNLELSLKWDICGLKWDICGLLNQVLLFSRYM